MPATAEIRIPQTTANPEHRQPITGVQLRGIHIPSRTRPAGVTPAITDLIPVLPAGAAQLTIAAVRLAEAIAHIVLQAVPAAAAALTVVRAAQAAAAQLIIVPAAHHHVAAHPTVAAAAHRVAVAVPIAVAHRAEAALGHPGQAQEDPDQVQEDHPGLVHQDQDVKPSINPGSDKDPGIPKNQNFLL